MAVLFLAQWGFTALLRAACSGHAEVVQMLLNEFGCSLDEENYVSVIQCPPTAPEVTEPDIPILQCSRNHWGVWSTLTDLKAWTVVYVSISCSQNGKTAVLLSAAGGHLDLTRELVEQHRADLHHKAKVSSTPSVCDSECDSHLSCAPVVSVAHIIPLKYTHIHVRVALQSN